MIGTPTRRLEGREKVSGATRFTADLELPGLLHVQLVLSHLASAEIKSINGTAARSVPGVGGLGVGEGSEHHEDEGTEQGPAARHKHGRSSLGETTVKLIPDRSRPVVASGERRGPG